MRQSRTTRTRRAGLIAAAVLTTAGVSSGPAKAQITTYSNQYNGGSTSFMGLGFFSDAGTLQTSTRESKAFSISLDGRYVTGYSFYEATQNGNPVQIQEAFRLDLTNLAAGFEKLGNLGGTQQRSLGQGVATNGTVVGLS